MMRHFLTRGITLLAPVLLVLIACNRAPVPPPIPPVATSLFREVAEIAGLKYTWHIEGGRPCNILQTIGNGCAFLDYDQDGNQDILLVGPKPADRKSVV